MSTHRLVFWITILSIFAMAARISMDTDTWWHLRAGEWMFQHRAILQQDIFSYTRYGQEWNYPGWLIQIPMYLIYKIFGPGGLNMWTALLVAAAFSFSWFTLRGGHFLKAFLLVLAAAASGVFWSARPHLVTFVFASATLYILEKSSSNSEAPNRNLLYWLPVIMVLWVNSHGGFVVGLILWGIYWISEQVSWISEKSTTVRIKRFLVEPKNIFKVPDFRLSIVGLLMVAAVSINPAGIEMFKYPFLTLGIEALKDYIQEWQSPDFHSLSVQPFLWLLFLGFGAVGLSRQRITLADFLLFTIFGYMGFMAGRNIALFSLAAPLVISRHLDPVLSSIPLFKYDKVENPVAAQSGRRAINLLLLAVICVAVILKAALVYPTSVNLKEFQKFLPVQAVEALNQQDLNGRLFNSYNWGGYLLWALPDLPVFIDGRTDLYNDEIIQQWLTVVQVKNGWEEVLDSYKVNLVINETESALSKSLMGSDHWSKIYQDPVAVVFSRNEPLQ